VRPDGYVAVADPESRATKISEFLDTWKLTPKKTAGTSNLDGLVHTGGDPA